jgi:hypothetical protein
MLRSPPQFPSCLKPSARNGLSLSRNDPRLRGSRPGVNGPGLLLRLSARCFLRPVRFRLHRPSRFAPGQGCFFACRPLRSPQLARLAAFSAPTPLRGFYSPTDQSVPRFTPPCGLPSNPPDFPSLPRTSSISSFRPRSSFQARYVSVITKITIFRWPLSEL